MKVSLTYHVHEFKAKILTLDLERYFPCTNVLKNILIIEKEEKMYEKYNDWLFHLFIQKENRLFHVWRGAFFYKHYSFVRNKRFHRIFQMHKRGFQKKPLQMKQV